MFGTLGIRSTFDEARSRAKHTGAQGADRLWALRVETLERVDELLDRADALPAVGRLAGAAGSVIERRLARLAAVPVADWDGLNAKSAIAAVRDLDRAGLRAARRREAATKERKTVLQAIDSRLAA